jgi:hypothetical protein
MDRESRPKRWWRVGLALLVWTCCGSPGGSNGDCSFSILTRTISPMMATVGIVEWSTTMSNLASAQIVYSLDGAGPGVLNTGGTAPVDLTKPAYRTWLLGLKPSSDYTFHVEATDTAGATCESPSYPLPTTGALPQAPKVTRTVYQAATQARGFIVTSSGLTYGNFAVIIDADGTVVWYAVTPNQCTRARMDYEGVNMWMVAVNDDNSGGEMRFVSMDGQTVMTNISGLSRAHHDFAVLPGKIAAMAWTNDDVDPPSELVELSSDGSGAPTPVFEIGANLYVGNTYEGQPSNNTYHCNSILYHPVDDSFTIGDRYPNLYVKVSHAGALRWQFGGSCADAPAGANHCVAEGWQQNHGHHLLDDGTMLLFNNDSPRASHVLQFALSTAATLSATLVEDFSSGDRSSNVLGDVQRLPNGNTLISYSTDGALLEVDPSWAPVQEVKGTYGYADWRASLYGPPPR